ASITCDKTKDTVGHGGVIFTRTNFVTLKYVTDSWGMDLNGFKLVITAFKDGKKTGCREVSPAMTGFASTKTLFVTPSIIVVTGRTK
ncbi:Putative LOC100164329, partial [Caligus rogercresseyi]